MTSENVPLFSSSIFSSWFKTAILYLVCYSIDKKAHRKGKYFRKRIADTKLITKFADEIKERFH